MTVKRLITFVNSLETLVNNRASIGHVKLTVLRKILRYEKVNA